MTVPEIPEYKKRFQEKIKLYQSQPDVPVWLKAGLRDKILFGVTIALCGLGLIGCGQFIWDLEHKKKK